jgi:hypothetical protein
MMSLLALLTAAILGEGRLSLSTGNGNGNAGETLFSGAASL